MPELYFLKNLPQDSQRQQRLFSTVIFKQKQFSSFADGEEKKSLKTKNGRKTAKKLRQKTAEISWSKKNLSLKPKRFEMKKNVKWKFV